MVAARGQHVEHVALLEPDPQVLHLAMHASSAVTHENGTAASIARSSMA